VVAALAATLALWTGLAFLAAEVLRAHYQTPLATRRLQLAGGDLPIHQWWTHGGTRASEEQINQGLRAIGVQSSNGGGTSRPDQEVPPSTLSSTCSTTGTANGPATSPTAGTRPFQWIEFGWLAVLSLLLLAATLWLVRRLAA
jgi:hypothetical protein